MAKELGHVMDVTSSLRALTEHIQRAPAIISRTLLYLWDLRKSRYVLFTVEVPLHTRISLKLTRMYYPFWKLHFHIRTGRVIIKLVRLRMISLIHCTHNNYTVISWVDTRRLIRIKIVDHDLNLLFDRLFLCLFVFDQFHMTFKRPLLNFNLLKCFFHTAAFRSQSVCFDAHYVRGLRLVLTGICCCHRIIGPFYVSCHH